MRWSDLLRMSLGSLRRRKLRTFLTILGVVIGTTSIVVMISLGLGLQESMYRQVEESGGTTTLTVYGKDNAFMGYGSESEEETDQYLTDEAMDSFAALEHVESAYPRISTSGLALKGRYQGYLDIIGMTREDMETQKLQLNPGGTLPDSGSGELTFVFGNMVLMNFNDKSGGGGYWETGELPDIDLQNDQLFLILDQDSYYQNQSSPVQSGEMSGDEGTSTRRIPKKYVVSASGVIAGGENDYNQYSYSAICDIVKLKDTLQREFRGRVIPGQPVTEKGKPIKDFVYSSAVLRADDMDNVEELAQTIRNMGYTVNTNMELIEEMRKSLLMVQAVLGGIGAVALLVAAIGITNTMMMSIYERTKEIGIMKVIGCSLRNIRQLFLLEAAFIGLIGGIAGNILSLILSGVINLFASSEALTGTPGSISYIPFWLMLASSGFAILVGMAAGYFPAVRAMKLSPLAAIRGE